MRAAVDIYPAERRVMVKGRYVFENKTSQPLDTLRLQVNPDVVTTFAGLPAHTVVLDDQVAGFRILKLAQPMAPGARLALDFTVDVRRPGFSNAGRADTLNLNGTFFNNREFFPLVRLPERVRTDWTATSAASAAWANRSAWPSLKTRRRVPTRCSADDADWISFDTTVSTSGDQIALAPGYLQKSWEGERPQLLSLQDGPEDDAVLRLPVGATGRSRKATGTAFRSRSITIRSTPTTSTG